MSEKSLDKLIATLKSEGIEAADREAGQIVEKAREQARKIVEEAEAKSEEILNKAAQEAQDTLNKGEEALKQAARDLSISVQNDLLALFGTVLEKEVEADFGPDLMEKVVLKVVENVGSGTTLQLPENMETKLVARIRKKLQAIDNVDAVTKDKTLLNGFAVAKTDEGWNYRISPAEVAELLHTYLSPRWVDILKGKSGS